MYSLKISGVYCHFADDALPVKPEWVFPSVSPVESDTYNVDEPATFTVDFDDNTDAGDTGDDGEENDSPVRPC